METRNIIIIILLILIVIVITIIFLIKRKEGVVNTKKIKEDSYLLSEHKPVYVFPPWEAFPGENLVDGNPHTSTQSAYWVDVESSYVEINLLKKYLITDIIIYRRFDCCTENAINCCIYIDGILSKCVTGEKKQVIIEYKNIDKQGQKVKISLDKDHINLSEVEIYGKNIKK